MSSASPLAPARSTAGGARALYLLGLLSVLKAVGLVLVAEAIARSVIGLAAGSVDPEPVWLGAVGALIRGVALWVTRVVGARAAVAAKAELRAGLLRRATAGTGDDQRLSDGALAVTATRSLDDLDDYFTSVLPALTGSLAIPLLIGARILLADWVSAAVLLVTLPLVPVFMVLIGKYTADRVSDATHALDQLSTHLVELARGLPVLIGLGRANAQERALRRVSEDYRATTMQTLRVAFLSALALELIATISVALVAVFIGVRLVAGEMELADGLLALILAPECFLPLRQLGAAFHASENGLAAYHRTRELTDQPVVEPCGAPAAGADTALEIRSLTVTYPGRPRPVCAPVDLSVPGPGLTVLAGESGSGKTTLLGVLGGGVRAQDGVEISGRITGVPRRIAQAVQTPRTYADTVGGELALYCAPEWAGQVPAERIEWLSQRALERAGLDVEPGRACAALSPGELRRLALARAFAQVELGADLLLLDEPTAHLDANSAGRVRRSVEEIALTIPVIVASHDRKLLACGQRVELHPADPTEHMGWSGSAGTVSGEVATVAPSVAVRVPLPAVETAPGTHRESAGEPTTAESAVPEVPLERLLARLARVANVGSGRFWLAALCGVCAIAAGSALTGVSAWLIVYAADRPPIMYLMVAIVGVRFFGLSRSAFTYAKQLNLHDAVLAGLGALRVRIWHGFAGRGTADRSLLRGDIALRRLVGDVDDVRDLAPRVVLPPLVALVVAVAAVVALLLISPHAGLIACLGLVCMLVFAPAITLWADRRASRARLRIRSAVLQRVTSLLAARADLRAGGVAERAVERVLAEDHRARAAEVRAVRATGLGEGLVTAVGVATSVAMIAGLGPDVAAGALSPALFAVTVLLPLSLIDCALEALSAIQQWPALAAGLAGLEELDGRPVEEDPPESRPESLGRHLELDDISASWGATEVFEHLNLQARPGRWTVLTGPSGSGKTTALSVILRFLDPTAGRYRIDGLDALRLDARELSGTIAWCPQEAHVFDSSLRANLLLARPVEQAPDDDRLREVLAGVGLTDLVDQIGLDGRIGSAGSALSGGQRQRLAVARTLLTGAPVVVLDEPTAHLDAATSATVLKDLRESLAERTVIDVTHDPTEIAAEDLVVRLPARA